MTKNLDNEDEDKLPIEHDAVFVLVPITEATDSSEARKIVELSIQWKMDPYTYPTPVIGGYNRLEYGWEGILISSIKRNIGLNEKLPLKCWLCKWNERCRDKVCQSVYYRVRPHPVTYEFYEFDDDLYEGSNGLPYEEPKKL